MNVDEKGNRAAAVQSEDAHQAALASLSEEFVSEMDEAYAVANTETEIIWRLRASVFLQTEST